MSTHTLIRRFTYNGWANLETLRSLERQTEPVPDRALAILGHIVAAERRWFARLGWLPASELSLPVWPTLSLEEIAEKLSALGPDWPTRLSRNFEAAPNVIASFKDTAGNQHSTSVGDILEHVLLHGAYHRGQIATLLGRAGLRSASTDFVQWIRIGEPTS
jgi:uncharacterized damage-inducible protein DinB